MSINFEMVALAERPDVLKDLRNNAIELQEFAEQYGFKNVVQMFQHTLPYLAHVKNDVGGYLYTLTNDNQILLWNCRTVESMGSVPYQTKEEVVSLIKVLDRTNVLTEKIFADFFNSINHNSISINEPTNEMER